MYSRWKPVTPLGMPLFVSNMVASWHPCPVKASRISQSGMIFTMTIIFPPILSWSPTNGDGHLIIERSFLKLYSIGRCWTTNRSIRNRKNSSPSAFWKMDNSTIQLEIRWTLHLGSAGGENFIFFLLDHVSSSNCHILSDRTCPGKHLAHSSLTLAAASVLSTFDLVKKMDENGREIEPKKEYTRTALR